MTDLTTDALKRLAASITPGGWVSIPFPATGLADEVFTASVNPQISLACTALTGAERTADANARAIALVPALLRELIERREADAGMRALLRAGCDLLADEYDNLKASITMPDGSLSANPLDAWAVEKVAAVEDWIASVKATLYPATPTTEASHGE